jgi:hemolysin activation/secretion protein
MDLPAIGWDPASRTGRGYVQGRIRAENLSYLEAEYRTDLTKDGLWGAAVFLNLTSASDPTTRALQAPNVGAGFGLRVKLTKESRTNITLDLGMASGGSYGFFLGTGEAF